MRDSRGTLLAEGQRVAYNISGCIAIGRIIELRARSGYSYTGHSIKVIMEQERCAGCRQGHITKIKHATSVLVIQDGDHR